MYNHKLKYINSRSQIGQDIYALICNKFKNDGFFIEIGSHDPEKNSNTYLLDKDYNWKGIMIEYDKNFIIPYRNIRPNMIHIFENAIKIDYEKLFQDNNVPYHIDYLQIDIEATNGSTINALINLEKVMDKYKFGCVTFEHDIYRENNKYNTRSKSREIFEKHGYILVLPNICSNNKCFEDWYLHPDIIDGKIIDNIKKNNIYDNKIEWKNIML